MNRERDDDPNVDAWLAQARLDPVPDDGFTAAVMARVPARRRVRWRRAPLIGALAGAALLGLQLGQTRELAVMAAGAALLTVLAAVWAYAERDS